MNCPNCKQEIPVEIINKFVAGRAGKSKSKKKSESSARNGIDTRPHILKLAHFNKIFPHSLDGNERLYKFPLIIGDKKTTYNPDFWCKKLECWIECATSKSNISEQGKKWALSIKNGLKLRVFWWDGSEITEQILSKNRFAAS